MIGATGTVGQRLVRRLHDHPWFRLTTLAASSRSTGKSYGEAVHWLLPTVLPESVAKMEVCDVQKLDDCDVVFSALGSSTAREIEPLLARRGLMVVSNASALRMHPQVPLLIPEVNPDHLAMLDHQDFGSGGIVTNPNCATVGLVLSLKPLADAFGIEAVQVTTLQAISGAGHPGVPSLDILGNTLPLIPGEEEKLENEPQKILGTVADGVFSPARFSVSAQANRVPVIDGHLLSVSVRLVTPGICRRCAVGHREIRLTHSRSRTCPSAPASRRGGRRRPTAATQARRGSGPRHDGDRRAGSDGARSSTSATSPWSTTPSAAPPAPRCSTPSCWRPPGG